MTDLRYLATHNFDYNVCMNFIFMQNQIQDWTADEFTDLSKGPDLLCTSNHTACWIFHSIGDYAIMYFAFMPPYAAKGSKTLKTCMHSNFVKT